MANPEEVRQPVVAVVDDSEIIRSTYTAMLEPEGYKILQFASGEDFLPYLKIAQPDVLLLDVQMPGMDGFEVCRTIKAQHDRPFFPIIMVSSLEGPRALVKGLGVGADEFISKPLTRLELCARVHSMLRIKALSDQLREQAAQLQQAQAQREAFTTFFFHDMRNSLSAVLSNIAELSRMSPHDPDLETTISGVAATGQSLALMAGNMLTLTVGAGWTASIEWLEITDLVYQAMGRVRGLARVAMIEVNAGDLSGWFEADRSLLDRILDNLLDNAVKVSPPNGVIRISGSNGTLIIEDEGPGLPVDVQHTIFQQREPVWQNLRGRGSTVGIGLAFSRLAARAFHGELLYDHSSHKGARFILHDQQRTLLQKPKLT